MGHSPAGLELSETQDSPGLPALSRQHKAEAAEAGHGLRGARFLLDLVSLGPHSQQEHRGPPGLQAVGHILKSTPFLCLVGLWGRQGGSSVAAPLWHP